MLTLAIRVGDDFGTVEMPVDADDEVDETAENALDEGAIGMLSGDWKDTLRGGGMTIPSSGGGGPSSFSNTVYVTVAVPSSITAEMSCMSIANWSKSTPH